MKTNQDIRAALRFLSDSIDARTRIGNGLSLHQSRGVAVLCNAIAEMVCGTSDGGYIEGQVIEVIQEEHDDERESEVRRHGEDGGKQNEKHKLGR